MAFIGNTNTTQAFTPAIDYFSGNASTTAFTLSRPVASVAQVQVVVNNVAQNPSSAYTISSNTITFTSAPTSGTNNIYVYYTSPITQVIAPGQGTVTSDSFGTITNFTTTGNTTLGDATSDTLTVGVTGIVKDASGNVGIGTASPSGKLNVISGSVAQLIIGFNATSASYLDSDAIVFRNAATSEAGRFTSTGLFQFNSGYGSVATAYGCRAWVNFNGTGTVAIRASGNVTSITDNGTGDYTINFTTAMPDANYSVAGLTIGNSVGNTTRTVIIAGVEATGANLKSTTQLRIQTGQTTATVLSDMAEINISIFR